MKNAIEWLNYKVGECSVGFEPEKVIDYDEKTEILIAFATVNCCGVNVTVEKNSTYKIVEHQYGQLCRCIRKVTIFGVPIGAKVEFIDKDSIIHMLTPYVNVAGFCGWSTYGSVMAVKIV